MKFVTISKARNSIAELVSSPERSVITKNGEPAAVIMDFDQYRAMRADVLLMRNKEQLTAVLATVDAVDRGDFSRFRDIPGLESETEPPKKSSAKTKRSRGAGAS